jgi:hypothetical protein
MSDEILTEADLLAEVQAEPVEETEEPVEEIPQGTPEEIPENAEESTSEEETAEQSDDEAEEELTNFQPLTMNVKVNGEERDVEIDSEEKLKEYIQRGLSADQKYKDASQNVQQMEDLLEKLKSPGDARNILSRLAGEEALQELAESVLAEQYDLSQMSEEQRAIYEENKALKLEKEQRDSELNEIRSREEIIQDERDQAEIIEDIKSAIPQVGLPDNDERFVYSVAREMEIALDNNQEISPIEAAKSVRDQHQVNLMHYAKSLSPEQFVELIGVDKLKELNNYSVKQVRKTHQPPPKSNYGKYKGNKSSELEDKMNRVNPDAVFDEIWMQSRV